MQTFLFYWGKVSITGLALLCLWVQVEAQTRGRQRIESFSKAKRILARIYSQAGRQLTFYCGCWYEGKQVDWKSCGYAPRKNPKRAARIEWEHIVPASKFGQNLPEWRHGHPSCRTKAGKAFKGRKCARKANKSFRLMEADLYNLVPAIGEVNGDRSNLSFGIVPGEPRAYGACDFERKGKVIEPRPAIRGNIARIYLYMNQSYPGLGIISKSMLPVLKAWSKADPPDEWECKRVQLIAQVLGKKHVAVAGCAPWAK